jgi:hypothetical protein
MALEQRQPTSGLMHHSDRGSQYASHNYTDLLQAHGCQISMSHKASPWENGGCESWMKTLKYEEVFRQEYRDLGEARTGLKRFIEKVYNQQRLHSALGYRPPAEFEQALLVQKDARAVAEAKAPFTGNPASDRILLGLDCNRHSRVCADASGPFTGLPHIKSQNHGDFTRCAHIFVVPTTS